MEEIGKKDITMSFQIVLSVEDVAIVLYKVGFNLHILVCCHLVGDGAHSPPSYLSFR